MPPEANFITPLEGGLGMLAFERSSPNSSGRTRTCVYNAVDKYFYRLVHVFFSRSAAEFGSHGRIYLII